MDIYIYDSEKEHTGHLSEMCLRYFFQKNRDGQIRDIFHEQHVPEEYKGLLSLFMLAYRDMKDEQIRHILDRNQLSYIILLVNDFRELLKGISPNTRPSGCLIKPAQLAEVEHILDEVWEDSERMKEQDSFFVFKVKAAEYSIACSSILFFESSRKKIILRTVSQEFEFYDSMEKILEKLPGQFMRIHKSFIANTRKIQKTDYAEMNVWFEDESCALISRTYKKALQEKLEAGKGQS